MTEPEWTPAPLAVASPPHHEHIHIIDCLVQECLLSSAEPPTPTPLSLFSSTSRGEYTTPSYSKAKPSRVQQTPKDM
jgi:hypothetical protein